MELIKESRDNIVKLSALCGPTSLFLIACKEDIINIHVWKIKNSLKYSSSNNANRRVIDKKIAEEVKRLTKVINLMITEHQKIENSMRNTLGDEVVDALIDEIDLALDKVELDKYLKK